MKHSLKTVFNRRSLWKLAKTFSSCHKQEMFDKQGFKTWQNAQTSLTNKFICFTNNVQWRGEGLMKLDCRTGVFVDSWSMKSVSELFCNNFFSYLGRFVFHWWGHRRWRWWWGRLSSAYFSMWLNLEGHFVSRGHIEGDSSCIDLPFLIH